MRSLGNLLPELMILVIEQLQDDLDTLRSLCLVRSDMRHLVEPVLYRQILIRAGEQCDRLLLSIESYPRRAQGIQVINALWTYGQGSGLKTFSEIILKSNNLKRLSFEGPLCNSGSYWQHDENWGHFKPNLIDTLLFADSLQHNQLSLTSHRLTALTLHWQYGCWTIGDDLDILFTHATLRELTLSCANICGTMLEGYQDFKQTPLKSLTLIECNFDHEGLRKVLSMPRALEYLYLGENKCYSQHCPNIDNLQLLARNTYLFFEALNQQSRSLVTFTYKPSTLPVDRNSQDDDVVRDGFAKFRRLTSFNLDSDCPEVFPILSSPSTRPPQLQNFRFYNTSEPETIFNDQNTPATQTVVYAQLDELSVSLAQIQTLQRFEVVLLQTTFTDQHKESLTRISKKLTKTIAMIVMQEQNSLGYIPPFLANEPLPIWSVVLDSSDPDAVCREIPYDPFGRCSI